MVDSPFLKNELLCDYLLLIETFSIGFKKTKETQAYKAQKVTRISSPTPPQRVIKQQTVTDCWVGRDPQVELPSSRSHSSKHAALGSRQPCWVAFW